MVLQVVLRYRNLSAVEDAFNCFVSFVALVLGKELFDRIAAHQRNALEWHCIIDDLADLSEI